MRPRRAARPYTHPGRGQQSLPDLPSDMPVRPPSNAPRLGAPPKQPPKFIHPRDRRPPDSFSPFLRLPLELRLKIWHTCFPNPREVRLDLGVLKCTPTKLPTTLFVNQESRRETLKQYTIAFPTDIFKYDSDPVTPPFCFNPRKDSLFCRVQTMVSEDMSKVFPLWLEYLGKHHSGGLNSALHLRVTYDTPPTFYASVPENTVVEEMLEKFSSLKTLFVDGVPRGRLTDVEHRLRSYLEKSKGRFVYQLAPKLTIVCENQD